MNNQKLYTYDQVAGFLMIISLMMLLLASTWNMENQIETLELKIEQDRYLIDSLQSEIDTLTWETEIWDHDITYKR